MKLIQLKIFSRYFLATSVAICTPTKDVGGNGRFQNALSDGYPRVFAYAAFSDKTITSTKQHKSFAAIVFNNNSNFAAARVVAVVCTAVAC